MIPIKGHVEKLSRTLVPPGTLQMVIDLYSYGQTSFHRFYRRRSGFSIGRKWPLGKRVWWETSAKEHVSPWMRTGFRTIKANPIPVLFNTIRLILFWLPLFNYTLRNSWTSKAYKRLYKRCLIRPSTSLLVWRKTNPICELLLWSAWRSFAPFPPKWRRNNPFFHVCVFTRETCLYVLKNLFVFYCWSYL